MALGIGHYTDDKEPSMNDTTSTAIGDTPALGRYRLKPMDVLNARAAQLAAILHAVTGDGFAAFTDLAPKMQHDYLWAASSMVDDCVQALEELQPPPRANGGAQ